MIRGQFCHFSYRKTLHRRHGHTWSTSQIELFNFTGHLTGQSVPSAARLYESLFTGRKRRRPDELFSAGQIDESVTVLEAVRQRWSRRRVDARSPRV